MHNLACGLFIFYYINDSISILKIIWFTVIFFLLLKKLLCLDIWINDSDNVDINL